VEIQQDVYVIDTHALIWFLTNDRRLPEAVRGILLRAEEGRIQVLAPTIVLAEIMHIADKRQLGISIRLVLEKIEQSKGFAIVPLDAVIIKEALNLPGDFEIHDRIIGATALYYSAILITRDQRLLESKTLSTFWESQ
jgi:PIN domain nuclease of toxin-antitoxin system